MSENVTTEPVGASANVLAELSEPALDQKINDKIQMIGSALKGHARAIAEVEKCEKSAVRSAWRLGGFLVEKKRRLEHGEWLPWLASLPHVSATSATNYMRIANQIDSAADLGLSIRATLRALPEPATATPKVVPVFIPVEVDSPAVAKPKSPTTTAVKIVEPDLGVEPNAETISALEKELYGEREKTADLEERIAIILESADPKAQEIADTINNQRALIKTLKASVSEWQSKASAARKENGALKRRIKSLEKEIAVA